MTTKQLEEYLAQTGHHGNYEDALHNCFCDNPKTADTKITKLEIPVSSGGTTMTRTIDLQSQDPAEYAALLKAQRGIREAIRWIAVDRIDKNIMTVLDVRNGYAYYTSKRPAPDPNTTTPKRTMVTTSVPDGAQDIAVTTNEGDEMTVTDTPDNLSDLESGNKLLGGGWLWGLLIGGLVLGTMVSGRTKVVEA